jgi:uncharacterized membrane protein (UPF0127 family)
MATRRYVFNRTRQAFLASDVELANSHLARARGLMFRACAKFTPGHGLWIVPCHGVHTLGMRFAIDAIYLDDALRVVHIEEDLRPWRLGRVTLDAISVLEVPARTVWTSGTDIGDQLEIAQSAGVAA